MLETEEAILRVANKLCKMDLQNPCQQPCGKHSAEARLAVYTLLDAAADSDEVPDPEGFKSTKAAVAPGVIDDLAHKRKKYLMKKVPTFDGYSTREKEVLEEVYDWREADLLSSEIALGRRRRWWVFSRPVELHYPMFDLDLDAKLIPSTREKHHHLYVEKTMTWRGYKRLLTAMYRAGLIEKGWYKLTTRRGMATLWLPERKNALLAHAQKDSYGWRRMQKVRYLGS